MKTLSVVAGIVTLLSSAPAFASSVSMTFQNVGTATMVPNGVNPGSGAVEQDDGGMQESPLASSSQ